jgi:hypothetical protein
MRALVVEFLLPFPPELVQLSHPLGCCWTHLRHIAKWRYERKSGIVLKCPMAPTQCIHVFIHACTVLVAHITFVHQQLAVQPVLFPQTIAAVPVASWARRVQ